MISWTAQGLISTSVVRESFFYRFVAVFDIEKDSVTYKLEYQHVLFFYFDFDCGLL